MTDVLADALDYSMGPERRRRLAADILVKLTRAGYALVRTPETLDVERLRAPYGGHPEFGPRVVANQAQPSIAGWESLAKDVLLAFDQARAALAASPAPDPGAGLREAAERAADFLTMLGGEWKAKYGEPVTVRTEDEVVAALRAALAPSAEPPETETT